MSGATRHDFQAVAVDPDAPAALGPQPRPGRAPRPTDPATQPGSATFHGSATRDPVVPRSPFFRGPFGRLFRELPPWIPPGANDGERERALADLSGRMLETPATAADGGRDNPGVPAAYTYFGQFVDHDITFDPTSSLTKLNDPDRLVNFRTPRFDLDNLSGEGPDDEPFLYDRTRPGHFVLGKGPNDREKDLPRNEQGTSRRAPQESPRPRSPRRFGAGHARSADVGIRHHTHALVCLAFLDGRASNGRSVERYTVVVHGNGERVADRPLHVLYRARPGAEKVACRPVEVAFPEYEQW